MAYTLAGFESASQLLRAASSAAFADARAASAVRAPLDARAGGPWAGRRRVRAAEVQGLAAAPRGRAWWGALRDQRVASLPPCLRLPRARNHGRVSPPRPGRPPCQHAPEGE